jgi:hypothetical protein
MKGKLRPKSQPSGDSDGEQEPKPNPFDPARIRINPEYLHNPVAKELLVSVPVRKPNRQEFFRVHQNPDYQIEPAGLLEFERDIYLVEPELAIRIGNPECRYATLHLCISRQKVVFLWGIPLPNEDGPKNGWHESARAAAEEAKQRWVRMVSNREAGVYRVQPAIIDFGEAEWPELEFSKILEIGFKDRYINSYDHIVLRKLRGEA